MKSPSLLPRWGVRPSGRGLLGCASVVAALLLACGPRAGDSDPVVARADGLEVRGADLVQAAAGRGEPRAVLADRAQLDALAADLLLAEAQARAARELPGAEIRARAAAREAAIRLLVPGGRAPEPALVEAYYRDHLHEFVQPAAVRLRQLHFRDCTEAQRVRDELQAGRTTLAAVAPRYQPPTGPGAAPGEAVFRPVDSLGPRLQAAVAALHSTAALSEPIPEGSGCLVVQVAERRAAQERRLDQVRELVTQRLRATGTGAARRELAGKLMTQTPVTVDQTALGNALAVPARGEGGATVVATAGERLTVAEVRLLARVDDAGAPRGGHVFLAQRLRDELVLWVEAKRRGLDRRPEVRAAVRTALAAEWREHALAGAAAPTDAEVEDAYRRSLGDYTTPARTRLAALVTRERAKAERWAATLRAARFPADAFDRLLAESEDATAAQKGGDLGWYDERTTNLPETFKQVALALPRPGATSGVVLHNGVFHVLLCRDRAPARVRPLGEVAPAVRERLLEHRRRQAEAAAVAALRGRLRPVLDYEAIARLAQAPGPSR